MLQPTNRLTLIDAIRPPAGFHLESSMAVTFTLNLSALLAAPAAFAIGGAGDSADTDAGGPRPVELIHALHRHARKLTIFSEAGHISLPPASLAFAFLERAVVSVQGPPGGIVHPKVWVLRYEAATDLDGSSKGDKRLRVIITSRNLTFDRSWDTVLRLDESPDPTKGALLGAVGSLFEGLLERALDGVSKEHSERVASLAGALRTARFALPTGVEDLRIHVLDPDRKDSPLPKTPDRSLIISPFLTDGFFSRVSTRPVDLLVSRQDQLDQLEDDTRVHIRVARVFKPALEDTGGDMTGDRARDRLSRSDPGRPLAGLHAKVFAFEEGDRARLFVGSANATRAAFYNNVEILAELIGPVTELGIHRLTGGNEDERGLCDLFDRYHRNPPNGPDTTDALAAGPRAIARIPIEGSVTRSGGDWAVTYRSTEPVPALEGIEIHCWPLTTPGNRHQVAPAEPLEKRFETSLERISGFLAFELAHSSSGEQTGFVVPVGLAGLPEVRDGCVLRSLIGNAERFLLYLLAVLYEDSNHVGLDAVIGRIETEGSGATGAGGGVGIAVLERLLGTVRRDPSKLLGLNPLIADLRKDEALPEGFAGLWDAIHEVAVEKAAEG